MTEMEASSFHEKETGPLLKLNFLPGEEGVPPVDLLTCLSSHHHSQLTHRG
jgi:hypothetical protein